jgi:hypothetical protein
VLMTKQQNESNLGLEPITDSSELDPEWNASNTKEMITGIISKVNGMVAYKRDIPIFKDGMPTGEQEKKPFLYIKIGDKVKPTKLHTSMNRKFKAQWGSNPKDWENKKIVSKYGEAFGREYLTWSPEGKLA